MMMTLKNNPQVAQIIKDIKASGMTAEEYFYAKAKEMNVNPDDILKDLR